MTEVHAWESVDLTLQVCKLGQFLFLVISLKQWMQTCSVYILQKKKLEAKETFTAVFGATK